MSLAATGCKADSPNSGDGDKEVDAGPTGDLAPPSLEAVPETTPLDAVAIRGTTDGTRVVAQGTASGSILAAVLPGGNFCMDADLEASGPTEMKLYSVGGDGRVSVPVDVTVTKDAAAPEPSDPNCAGTGGPTCDGPEICDNGDVDDDCNGLADSCDNACNACIDDVYEPNDIPIDVPMMEPGTYTMQICPCREDWYAFQRDMNQTISASITFDNSNIDIDMELYVAGPDGVGKGDLKAASRSTTGAETINFTTTEAGLYYLRIFAIDDSDLGSYNLDL